MHGHKKTSSALNRLTLLEKTLNAVLFERQQFIYDNNGNQLQTIRTTYTGGIPGALVITQQNTYDLRNQLIRTVTENGTIVENVYNGDGLRVEKVVNGTSTRYLYEYQRVVLEENSLGDVTGRNVYGTNLLMRTVGVDAFFYMVNAHADVTALLSTSGTIIGTYYYDAFGNILEQTGSVGNSILFAGYQYDKETGMYYLNARMYDPVTARFMQEDTYTGQNMDPLSLNLYTYCHNEPLMYSDPTGHSRIGWSNPRGKEPFSPPLKLKRDKSVVKSIVEEKEKQTKEAQRTHNRYDNIGRYLKKNPLFAEEDNVQLIMEQAGNMGPEAYLTAMEYYIADYVLYKPGESFEEWQEKQIRPNMELLPTDKFGKDVGIWEMEDRRNYATQRFDDVEKYINGLDYLTAEEKARSINQYLLPEKDLIAEVFAYTSMNEVQEDLFWDALTWEGTPYLKLGLGVKQKKTDCSAFARGLYLENGIFISIESGGYNSTGMWSAAKNSNNDTKDFYTNIFEEGSDMYNSVKSKGTSSGEIIYEWSKDDGMQSIDSLSLKTGDVIYYNLSDKKPGVDHVGIFLGYNSKGESVVIETRNETYNLNIIESGEPNYGNCTTQAIRSDGTPRTYGIVRYT